MYLSFKKYIFQKAKTLKMKHKYLLHLFIPYLLVNFFMLFNNGIIWDDWTVINMEKKGLSQQFGENGYWFLVYFHDLLNDMTYSPMLYHWLSFLFFFGAFAFVFKILKQFKLDETSAFFITLLAMLAPYYEARNLVICMSYAMFLFSFCLGLYLVFDFLEKGKNIKTVLTGTMLLFFSFFLNSLIPLFLFLVVLFFVVKNDFSITNMKNNNQKVVITNIGLIALPFIFWILRKYVFPVKGLYASSGYNTIKFSLKELPVKFKKIVSDNIIGIYNEFLSVFKNDFSFGVVVFIVSAIVSILVLKKVSLELNSKKKLWFYGGIGILLFFVGAFPYIVVNKLPRYHVYDTRHQILLSIGLSFIVYTIVNVFPRYFYIRKGIVVFFLAVFMSISINSNVNFLRGWVKIEAIQHDIRKINIETQGVVITKGFDAQFNATENPLTFYELSGIFKKTINRQDLFFVHWRYSKQIINMFPGVSLHGIKFNMKDVTKEAVANNKNDIILEALYNQEKISQFKILKLIALYYFSEKSFKSNIDDILSVKTYKS